MADDADINAWFCREVLPLERALTSFIRKNWRSDADVTDIRQDVYERAIIGARSGFPTHPRRYLYAITRNHLINRAKRARIVSFEYLSDLEDAGDQADCFDGERHLDSRDELRRTQAGLDQLPARCREVVRLRKIEGLSTREVAERLGVGSDTVEKQITHGMRALANFMLGGTGKIRRPPFIRRTVERKRDR